MKTPLLRRLWKSYRFPIILLGAIVLGSLIGIWKQKDALVLKPFGDIFLNAMFTIVVPLVFVTISSAVANMASLARLGRILGVMMAVFVVTGIIASGIMIGAVTLAPPAKGVEMKLEKPEKIEAFKTADQLVAAVTVSDFPQLLSRRNMMPLILFSILFGLCVCLLGEKGRPLAHLLNLLSEVMLKFIGILMYYAPIGLGAYFAALVGDFGPQLLGTYARAMAIYYPVCIGYFFVAFTLYAFVAAGRRGISAYWKAIITPSVTALATQSSVATLPVNLEAAEKIGVPRDIREIVLPIGATAHMDGSCLASILKIALLFGIFQHPFSGVGVWATAIVIAVLSGVVMSGVPGGGLIGEMLIVSMYGFPPEAFPVIAMIGYLVDPPATMVNASGDTVASMLVTRILEGRKWMAGKVGNL